MIRTLEDLNRQKETLFQKHPNLRDLRIVKLQEAGWDYRRLSDFIESCWRDYYRPEESRMIFSPEFLEWQMPELQGICALDQDGRYIGCILSFPRSYSQDNRMNLETFSVISCLSIVPNVRGSGIAQLLSFLIQEIDAKRGYSFSCSYLDQRKNSSGSSFQLWGTRKSRMHTINKIPLLAKSFDWRKSRKYGQLNIFLTLAARGIQLLFPSRRGHAFPGGRSVQTGALEHLSAVRDLIDAADRLLPIRRIYDDEELSRMIHFRKNAFHVLSYCLLNGDSRADAFLFGYKLPLGERDCAFFADGIIFRPGLPYSLRRSFLSECEGRLRYEEGCIGATLVCTASPESLLKYGYVPFDSQVLVVEPYVEMDLSLRNLRGLRIELR
jgi:hypothetical protein